MRLGIREKDMAIGIQTRHKRSNRAGGMQAGHKRKKTWQ